MIPKKSIKDLKKILGERAIQVYLSDMDINEMGLAVIRFVLAMEASKIKGQE